MKCSLIRHPESRKPFLHQLGVMIARVVEKDMDERQHRIERRDRFQEPDRRDGVDGYDLDHPGLAGREIDRAVNIDPLAPARLFDRELLLARRPAAGRPRRMGRMHRVREQHGFVVGQGIQEIIVALDECLLLFFVEFARDDVRLVILQPQTMQKRNQSRTAFVNEAEFLFDKGADLARRARQASRRQRPSMRLRCSALKKLALPPTSKLVRPSIPRCSNSLNQPRIVSSFNNRTHRRLSSTAPPVVQKAPRHLRVASRAMRTDPSRANAISLLRILFAEKAGLESCEHRNPPNRKIQGFSTETSMSRSILEEVLLSPALEHAVGDLDVAQVPSTGDHLRLMAAVAQARHLP